ncbi:hypothetical protein I4U23_000334 [Adineta vaga]|nr:hypothetical protein I4U23_000334 [Adineta vaga]
MYHADVQRQVNRRSSEDEDDIWYCLAVIFSFIDLIPFFCLLPLSSPLSNKAPLRLKFPSQYNQTWSQLFDNCSYERNSSGNYTIVCHTAIEPVSVFFLTAAFVLGLALLLFNIFTVTRKLTRNELITRTVIHMIYALTLFTTALTCTLVRYGCSNCQDFLFCSCIPIPTTLCMAYNWYDDGEQIPPHRQTSVENQLFPLRPNTSNPLSIYSGRIVSSQQPQLSLSIPRSLPENNADPQLENEYNEWLEAQQRHNQ